MIQKFFHNKLIRDNIPEVIKNNGGQYETRILGDDELGKELRKKLLEETNEILESSDEHLLEELADALEVIESLAETYGQKLTDIQKIQREKRSKRGRFKKKLFLIWSTQPSGK